MTDITALTSTFANRRNVLISGNNIYDYIAGGTIKAGMVVAFAADGEDYTIKGAQEADGVPVGVALYDAVTGDHLAVAGPGCIVNGINNDSDVNIDAGEFLMTTTNANVLGTVVILDPAIGGHNKTPIGAPYVVGISVAGSTGAAGGVAVPMLITLSPVLTASA